MPQSMLTAQEKADGDALVHFLLTDARTEEEEEFAQDIVLWWTLVKGEQAYKDVEINRDRMHIVLNPLNADLAAAEECRLLTRFPPDMHQRIRTAIFGADRDLMRLRNVGVVSTATAFFVLTSRLASPRLPRRQRAPRPFPRV